MTSSQDHSASYPRENDAIQPDGRAGIRLRQKETVTALALAALSGEDPFLLMDRATDLMVEVLDVEYAKVLELLSDGSRFLLRSGTGWDDGLVGEAEIETGLDSQAGYTLISGGPVVVEDFAEEDRFDEPSLLTDHDVAAGISARIMTGGEIYGVLGAHAKRSRSFSRDEVEFVEEVVQVLGVAIERGREDEALRRTRVKLDLLSESTDEGVVVHEMDEILEADGSFAELFGYEPDEIVGMSMAQLLTPESRSILTEKVRAGSEEPFKVTGVRKDGRTSPLEMTSSYCAYQGRLVCAAVARDASRLSELRASRRRFIFLAEANALLSNPMDYSTVITTTAQLTVPALGEWCFIDVLGEEGEVHRLAVAHADPEMEDLAHELKSDYPLDPNAAHGIPMVMMSGRPELVAELDESTLREMARDSEHLRLLGRIRPESYLCVPLRVRGRTTGTIGLLSEGSDRRYNEEDLKLAEDLAYCAGLALDNAFQHLPEVEMARELVKHRPHRLRPGKRLGHRGYARSVITNISIADGPLPTAIVSTARRR